MPRGRCRGGTRDAPTAPTAPRPRLARLHCGERPAFPRCPQAQDPPQGWKWNTRLVAAAMALVIGYRAAAHTRARPRSSPGAPHPKLGVSGGTAEGAGDTPPRCAWVLMPLRHPAPGAGGEAQGWVPLARPAPSPVPLSAPDRLLPEARGDLARTCKPGFFGPVRPHRRLQVRVWEGLVSFCEETRWAQGPTESCHCGGSRKGFHSTGFKRAAGLRPLFSAGGLRSAPFIHPGSSGGKPSYSSSRKRAWTN